MKLGVFKKIPEMLGFDGDYSPGYPKVKTWSFSVKISAVKRFKEKP